MRERFGDFLVALTLHEWRWRHCSVNPFADRCWR